MLIETYTPPPPTAAELAAKSIIETINSEIEHRVKVHQNAWDTIWANEREGATPAAILANLGTHAALVFAFSRINLQHIAACCDLVGKQPTDFLPAKYLETPQPITAHDDGTVSLTD